MSNSRSSSSSSTSSRLSSIEKNQRYDLESINKNHTNMQKNYKDIRKLQDRVTKLEERILQLETIVSSLRTSAPSSSSSPSSSPPQSKKVVYKPRPRPTSKSSSTKSTPVQQTTNDVKVAHMRSVSAQLQLDRSALIAFNRKNMALPESERHVWEKRLKKKDGSIVVQRLDRIVDNKSLDCLLRNDATRAVVNNMLVDKGGPERNMKSTIRTTYWVFLRDGKLTTISAQFKGGVGTEYLWTEDAALRRPSADWMNGTRRQMDPRRAHIDPRTMALWVPEEEVCEGKEEEEEGTVRQDGEHGVQTGSTERDGRSSSNSSDSDRDSDSDGDGDDGGGTDSGVDQPMEMEKGDAVDTVISGECYGAGGGATEGVVNGVKDIVGHKRTLQGAAAGETSSDSDWESESESESDAPKEGTRVLVF